MLRALSDMIVCEPMFFPDQTKGGIYIPESARSRVNQGIVKYIGPKVELVKPGNHVIFTAYSGTLMKLEDEGLVIIIPEKFISAIIETSSYEIPGLYFLDKSKHYWPCTYEFAIQLITKAAMETDWFRQLTIKEHKPSSAELYASE
jgi:chaperonin GroES